MIELSKRPLYVFLIAFMTVTQKWCLKTSTNHKNYLYTQSECFLLFCLSTNNCCENYIYAYIFYPKNISLDVVSVSYMIHTLHCVTKWIYNRYLKTKLIMKCLNLFLLKQIIKTQLFYFIMFIYVSIVTQIYTVVYQNCGIL